LQDPYLHRPLPFLIGSVEFDQNDDVGVGQIEKGKPDDFIVVQFITL